MIILSFYISAPNYGKWEAKFYIFAPNYEKLGSKFTKFSKFKKRVGLNSTIENKNRGLNSTADWKRGLNCRAYLLTLYMGCHPLPTHPQGQVSRTVVPPKWLLGDMFQYLSMPRIHVATLHVAPFTNMHIFIFFCILTYAIIYVLIHHIIFWLYLYFLNILYFFKYSCTNIFHRRSLYTFYSMHLL